MTQGARVFEDPDFPGVLKKAKKVETPGANWKRSGVSRGAYEKVI